jgi:hypothetical protein
MNKERKEFGKWWLYVLMLVGVSIAALGVLNYAGLFGKTFVERKVFENSYQYTEGQRARVNILRAQQVEIERQLRNKKLDGTTRSNLESQAAAIRVQLGAARSQR